MELTKNSIKMSADDLKRLNEYIALLNSDLTKVLDNDTVKFLKEKEEVLENEMEEVVIKWDNISETQKVIVLMQMNTISNAISSGTIPPSLSLSEEEIWRLWDIAEKAKKSLNSREKPKISINDLIILHIIYGYSHAKESERKEELNEKHFDYLLNSDFSEHYDSVKNILNIVADDLKKLSTPSRVKFITTFERNMQEVAINWHISLWRLIMWWAVFNSNDIPHVQNILNSMKGAKLFGKEDSNAEIEKHTAGDKNFLTIRRGKWDLDFIFPNDIDIEDSKVKHVVNKLENDLKPKKYIKTTKLKDIIYKKREPKNEILKNILDKIKDIPMLGIWKSKAIISVQSSILDKAERLGAYEAEVEALDEKMKKFFEYKNKKNPNK